MYAVQQLQWSAFSDVMEVPAWKYALLVHAAEDDQAIPADAERMFAERMGATTFEVPAGHLPMVSHGAEVANPRQLCRSRPEPGRAPRSREARSPCSSPSM